MSSSTHTYGTASALTASAYTKTDYTFSGWNTAMDGKGASYADKASVSDLTTTSGDTVTLYAQWASGSYTVKYDANSGSGSMSNSTHTYGVLSELTTNTYTKTGYTFTGWNTKADGKGTSYADGASVSTVFSTSGNIVTLYAQWTGISYSVKYDANGGSGSMNSSTHTYGTSSALTTSVYTKTGYTFAGWNTKADGTGTSYADGASVSTLTTTSGGTVTLYAQWTGIFYTVSYDANGGSGSMSNSMHTYGTASVLTTNIYTKTGYTFTGWNTSADGKGASYADGASASTLTTISGATVTLYAQWTGISYAVKYDANGGNGSMNSSTHTYGTSSALTTNVYTKTGYTFADWNTKADGAGTSYSDKALVSTLTTTPGATVTLYAQWTGISYTVSYDANGGSGSMSNSMHTYGTASVLTTNTYTKTGYTFSGWSTDIAGTGTSYTDGQSVLTLSTTSGAIVTLYAKWTANTYHLKFNVQGGTPTLAEQIVTFNDEVGILPTVTCTGYTFDGWYTAAKGGGIKYEDTTIYSISGDLMLYAKWEGNHYTLTFDAQSGVVSPANATVTYGSVVGTLPTPTYTGYTFVGWYTSTNGGGTEYTATITYSTAGNLTVYAQWTANSYTLTFDPQSGTVNSTNATVIYGSVVGTLPTPTRTGCTFGGWYTAANGGGTKYEATTKYSTASNQVLYAKWEVNRYTLTFDAQGGTVNPTSATVTYDSAVGTLPTPTRTGYTFGGWYVVANGGGAKYETTTIYNVLGNLTLYAKWIANSYTLSFDAQDGIPTPTNRRVIFGTAVDTLPTVTRARYTFDGWYTAINGGGIRYESTTIYSIAKNLTLYAKWEPLSITTLAIRDAKGNELVHWNNKEIGDTVFYQVPCNQNTLKQFNVNCNLPDGVSSNFSVWADKVAGGELGAGEIAPIAKSDTSLRMDINRPGRRVVTIVLNTAADSNIRRYTLVLNKNFELFDIVNEHLGNIRVVHNNPKTNRTGLTFSECTWWYKREMGEWSASKSGQLYYYAGPSIYDKFTEKDSMYLMLTLSDGSLLETCPDANQIAGNDDEYSGKSRSNAGRQSSGMAVYPNPVRSGGVVKFRQDEFDNSEDKRYVKYSLFDTQGCLILRGDTFALYEGQGLIMPSTPGVYHLLLEGEGGKWKVMKIAVGE
jgi:uncharacterized repeat protein (TIGR02543 family)